MSVSDSLIHTIESLLSESKINEAIKLLQSTQISEESVIFQIGKSVININEGRDIHIGDQIYQLNDIKSLENFFLSLLGDFNPKFSRESFANVKRNWASWEKTIHGMLFSDLDSPITSITSPLQKYWNRFIQEEHWHERLIFYRGKICKEYEAIINNQKAISKPITFASKDLIKKFKDIDFQINYESILADGIETLIDSLLSQVHELISQQENFMEDLEEGLISSKEVNSYLYSIESAKSIRHDLYELRKYAEASFNKCFLIVGRPGSGKTHFCASILSESEQCDKKVMLLTLEPDISKNLEETILDTVSHATKLSWNSLESFSNFLKGIDKESNQKAKDSSTKLIIAIDNLQSWFYIYGKDFNQELTNFIRRHTNLHNIFWLVMIRDSSYDRLLRSKHKSFWERYSFFESTETIVQKAESAWGKTNSFYSRKIEEHVPNINGWSVLDALNVQSQVGLEIIKASIKVEKDDLISLDPLDEHKILVEKISNPFIALLIVDLHKVLPLNNIINLNFIEFVEHFWNKLRSNITLDNSISSGLVEAGDLEDLTVQSVDFIVGFLIHSKNVIAPYTKLINYVSKEASDLSELQNRNLAKAVIDGLELNSLLKKNDKYIEARIDFFWGYEIAKRIHECLGNLENLREKNHEEFRSYLEDWLTSYKIEALQEEILEFFLLLLDQDQVKSYIPCDFVKKLWYAVLTSQQLSSAAGWFAASKASKSIQDDLINFVLVSSDTFISQNDRNLFAFMNFVRNLTAEQVNESVQLKLLQPYYSSMQEYSFSSYYIYIVEQLFLNLKSTNYFADCMIYISGCEVLEMTQIIAWLTINTLARNVEGNIKKMLDVVFEYLKKSSQRTKHKNSSNKKAPWTRYSYREWILCELSRYIVQSKGKDAFDFLVQNRWYRPELLQIGKAAGREMQREANLAIGYGYRSKWLLDEKNSFAEIINRLANVNDSKSREVAFFLIRHTEFTRQNKEILVDEKFHQALKKIFLDPKLDWLVKLYYKTFQKNIPNISKLEKRRQIILERSKKHIWY